MTCPKSYLLGPVGLFYKVDWQKSLITNQQIFNYAFAAALLPFALATTSSCTLRGASA
jgi:hypothetical protein